MTSLTREDWWCACAEGENPLEPERRGSFAEGGCKEGESRRSCLTMTAGDAVLDSSIRPDKSVGVGLPVDPLEGLSLHLSFFSDMAAIVTSLGKCSDADRLGYLNFRLGLPRGRRLFLV